MELPERAELEAIAADAGALALRHFQHVASERKADRTLVTAADREVEAFLVREIGSRLPEAGKPWGGGGGRGGLGGPPDGPCPPPPDGGVVARPSPTWRV